MRQESKQYLYVLHCNKDPPAGVKFATNKMIKDPEYGLFFIDEYGSPAFQRVSDIHKVETPTLLAYKMMDRHYKSPKNEEFMILMDKMMSEHPDKHVLLSKKTKLEIMGNKEVWVLEPECFVIDDRCVCNFYK